MAQDVLVVGELTDGKPTVQTAEMLGAANRVAEGGAVSVVLLGTGAQEAAQLASAAGADRAYVSGDSNYDDFRGEQWLAAIEAAMDQANPAVVLLAQSMVGRELGPRLAFRRNTAVAMDCVRLEMTDGKLQATRSAYGGNARATYSFNTSPAIVTVRGKTQDPMEARTGSAIETVELPAAGASRVEIASREEAVSEGLQLQDAPIVVSGGRGLGAPEGFQLVEQLAQAFGSDKAAVGASRAACDLGWYPPANQVGLTGKIVSPDLYVAVAISGASQHMAGCSGSKTIVAINRDREANIFKNARFGIVGDYRQVVPELIEAIKQLD